MNRFRNDIHIVHFAGALKPWQLTFNPENEQLSGNLGGQSDIQRDFLLSWWRVMHQHVWPNINQLNQVKHFFIYFNQSLIYYLFSNQMQITKISMER